MPTRFAQLLHTHIRPDLDVPLVGACQLLPELLVGELLNLMLEGRVGVGEQRQRVRVQEVELLLSEEADDQLHDPLLGVVLRQLADHSENALKECVDSGLVMIAHHQGLVGQEVGLHCPQLPQHQVLLDCRVVLLPAAKVPEALP